MKAVMTGCGVWGEQVENVRMHWVKMAFMKGVHKGTTQV